MPMLQVKIKLIQVKICYVKSILNLLCLLDVIIHKLGLGDKENLPETQLKISI